MWRSANDAYSRSRTEFLLGVGRDLSRRRCRVIGHSFTDNPDKFVLIFGGGYDTSAGPDQAVRRWTASATASTWSTRLSGEPALACRPATDTGADLKLGEDDGNSIPGEVRVVDLTGDGFADRMYAADLGGRIWRFDIFNGAAPRLAGRALVDGWRVRFART